MVLFLKNFPYEYVLVMDVEFDQMDPIQVAGMVFQRVNKESSLFQLSMSFNFFIQKEIDKYTERYTGITNKFLKENGMDRSEFVEMFNKLISDLDTVNTVFVSHGAKNDRKVLKDAGITSLPENVFCTYKNAKKVLKRTSKLTLSDIAQESGLMPQNSHNAYFDVLTTASVLSFLLKNDGE